MKCCDVEMFEGRDGNVTVLVCMGGCKNVIRFECPNEKEPLKECIPWDSYMCEKCGQEYYLRGGRLMKGSEALRFNHGRKL